MIKPLIIFFSAFAYCFVLSALVSINNDDMRPLNFFFLCMLFVYISGIYRTLVTPIYGLQYYKYR